MEIIPMNCDMCSKMMGNLVIPDGIDGETIKQFLQNMAIAIQCEQCGFKFPSQESKVKEDDKSSKDELFKQITDKVESMTDEQIDDVCKVIIKECDKMIEEDKK